MYNKRANHEQELKMTLKKLSEKQLQIQQCKVQEVQSSVTSSGDETSSRIVSDEEIDKDWKATITVTWQRFRSQFRPFTVSTRMRKVYGRSTFANPKYLKKAQSDKPRLYEIPYDTSDPANRFWPRWGRDSVSLEKEIEETHENCKGKSVETQFNKPSVVRQPNAQRIPKPSVLGKPTPFSNSPEMRSFQTKQSVNKTNVSDGLFKQVTQQNLPQIRKQAVRTPNVICTWPLKISKACVNQSSRKSSSNDINRKQKAFLKSMNSYVQDMHQSAFTNENHDECVLEYLSRLNLRASAQNKDAKSRKTTKRYMPVEKSSASKKPERQIPTGHRFSNKKTTTVPEKTRTPRSCLRWQPTGRILKTVCLRWVPTGRLFNSCTSKVESEPTHGSNVDIYHIHACKQTLGLSAETSARMVSQKMSYIKRRLITADQASVFMAMMSVHISSGLVLHQMTSDHNRSELGIQDHSNEPSSSKLVPKVVPLAVKTATSRQELELLFHHHIAMLRQELSSKTSNTLTGKNPSVILVRDRCPRGKGLHFLNLFNDPRIIREQRIAAYKGYRGGGVVRVVMKHVWPYL
ncbi:hypothetical protein Tco_0450448 [Tanacetum coccineum]